MRVDGAVAHLLTETGLEYWQGAADGDPYRAAVARLLGRCSLQARSSCLGIELGAPPRRKDKAVIEETQ